jgi:hypothetical protein
MVLCAQKKDLGRTEVDHHGPVRGHRIAEKGAIRRGDVEGGRAFAKLEFSRVKDHTDFVGLVFPRGVGERGKGVCFAVLGKGYRCSGKAAFGVGKVQSQGCIPSNRSNFALRGKGGLSEFKALPEKQPGGNGQNGDNGGSDQKIMLPVLAGLYKRHGFPSSGHQVLQLEPFIIPLRRFIKSKGRAD